MNFLKLIRCKKQFRSFKFFEESRKIYKKYVKSARLKPRWAFRTSLLNILTVFDLHFGIKHCFYNQSSENDFYNYTSRCI